MKTYEEIVSEVNEVHPCSEKEAAMLYAEQFKPQWIPVTERLPKGADIAYLVSVKNKNKEGGIPLIDIAVFDSDGIWQKYTVWEDVTHWMNLPELPNNG